SNFLLTKYPRMIRINMGRNMTNVFLFMALVLICKEPNLRLLPKQGGERPPLPFLGKGSGG
ncbi:MAG: hypothetical protein WCL00_15960, partial [Bacteroidota bacterium]